MLLLLFYYIVLPFLLAALVLKLLRRFGGDPVPEEVRRFCADAPIPAKHFRALEVLGALGSPGTTLRSLGDFDAQDKAVDAAYLGRAEAGTERVFLVLNDKGDILEQV